jgi:hypothetical protein
MHPIVRSGSTECVCYEQKYHDIDLQPEGTFHLLHKDRENLILNRLQLWCVGGLVGLTLEQKSGKVWPLWNWIAEPVI